MTAIYTRQAQLADLDQIMTIIDAAKALLKNDGSPQWQDGHPDRQMITKDIQAGICYVLVVGQQVAGTATLMVTPDPCYAEIDGAWLKPDQPYATVHRLALAADFRGQHLSDFFMSNLLSLAYEKGLHQVRIDTHALNQRLQHLAQKFDFVYCGIIKVDDVIDPDRKAYELDF